MSAQPASASLVDLDAKDLPAFCPNPQMPIWCHHPRVYLDLSHASEARGPYCGTVYRLRAGQTARDAH
jgi:uncharacterized Zn-finger protein